jgi:hypothetical protein
VSGRRRAIVALYAVALAAAVLAVPAPAAAAGPAALEGATLGWPWALPFVGLLVSIAVGPQLFPRI